MKNAFLFLALLPSLLFAQSSGFVLTGKVTGFSEGTPVKINNVNDNNLVASSTIKSGSFSVNGSIPEPGLYWITLGSEQPQHIFLENTKVAITASAKDVKNLQVQGSQSHKDFDQFRNTFNPLMGELNANVALLNKTENEKKRADLMVKYDSIRKQH